MINNIFSNSNFKYNNKSLELSNKYDLFNIIHIHKNLYYIKTRELKTIGIDDKNNIIILEENINKQKIIWNIINIGEDNYIIQNNYNKKFISVTNNKIITSNFNISFILNKVKINKIIYEKYIFKLIKFFEKYTLKNEHIKYILKEPIDVVIKYIDLTDKTLNRTGIKQIYKDNDNEELRYSIRSILQNIPWIRKIFILMPNEKVRYFKSPEEIKEKIIYVKDKDLLGYDSANNCAFTFNLYKMEKFGLSKNFIYMDDDYFIAAPLKKTDFFYYDELEKKVFPFIIASEFKRINKKKVLYHYNKIFKIKDLINPHSYKGFKFSLLCTEKFFLELYNKTLIKTEYTHNAIPQNIDELREIYKEFKKYKYFNETIYSKERYILRLSQQEFYNLYELNIKQKKVNYIPLKYISIESLNLNQLNTKLFVINTGGSHIPTKKEIKNQKKIMRKKFPFKSKYEIRININLLSNFYSLYNFFIIIFIKCIKFSKKKFF